MRGDVLTRRAALIGLGAVASASLCACNTMPMAGVEPVPASGGGPIDVDTAPLVAYVGNPTAGWVQQSLPGALAQALGPAAGGVHVRVDTLYLGNGGPGDPDRMRGVATVGGRSINVRANSTYFPSPTDQALPEQAMQGRVQALSAAFAYRLKRRLGA